MAVACMVFFSDAAQAANPSESKTGKNVPKFLPPPDLTPQICTAPAPIDMAGAVPFGDGTPGSITQTTLQTLINNGGKIVFNGGAAPVTLTLTATATLLVDARKEVIIDGLSLLTISGNNAVRIFDKGAPAN